jgi:hypothetical protein
MFENLLWHNAPKWQKNYLEKLNTHPIVNQGKFGVLKDEVIMIETDADAKYQDTIDKILDYAGADVKPIKRTKNYTKADFDELWKMMNEVLFVYKQKLVQERLKKIKQMAG